MSLVVTSYNGVSFCSKDCFYAFYKLGNAPKSISSRASPRTPLEKLTALPQTPSWWGGGLPCPPQEPHPSSALRASAIQAMLCRPPTPPKINPSYGLISRPIQVSALSISSESTIVEITDSV